MGPQSHEESQAWEFMDFHLGVLGQKAIWMWPLWRGTKYIIRGKVVASLTFGPRWVLWVQVCSWFVLAPKVLQLCTNHFVLVLCRSMWVSETCQFFLVPSRSSSTPLYPSKVLWIREHALTFCSFVVFYLGLTFGSFKELGVRKKNPFILPLVTINCWTFVIFCFRQMMWHIIQLDYRCKNIIIGTSYMWIINIPLRRQGILWLLFKSRWDQVMAYINIIWYIS
jgi:hypothetical protein